ncbi:MAG: lysophospholipid acyltransferase family protein [Gammaproteobacteria bacterium]
MAKQSTKYRWLSKVLTPPVVLMARLLSFLPFSWLVVLGHGLGQLLYWFAPRLRHYATVNLALCFPQATPKERKKWLKKSFRNMGVSAMEMVVGYYWSRARLQKIILHLQGIEHIEAAQAANKGVILLMGHFTSFLLGARLLSLSIPIAGMYHHPKNKTIATIFHHLLSGFTEALFTRKEANGLVHYLQQGGVAVYLSDIDAKNKRCVFAPFFGVQAATLTSTARIAQQSGAVVIPFSAFRQQGGYVLTVEKPLDNFPSADHYNDALRINQCYERMVQTQRDQYLWQAKRFKTRPAGEKKVY